MEKKTMKNYGKDHWFPGVKGEGEINRQSTKDFQSSETSLYGTVMMGTCQYTFVQIHRMYNTESEPWGE